MGFYTNYAINYLVYQRRCLDKDTEKIEDKKEDKCKNCGEDTDKVKDLKSCFTGKSKCQTHYIILTLCRKRKKRK